MEVSEESLLELADSFHAAALNGDGWSDALEALSRMMGARSAQMIAIPAKAASPMTLMTGLANEAHDAFLLCRGTDPAYNPRLAAALSADRLKVLRDDDFISREERCSDYHYQAFAVPWDVPHTCLTKLVMQDEWAVSVAVYRAASQGSVPDEQCKNFAAIARHISAAVRLHFVLENQGNALLTHTLDALSITAFLCDEDGQVRAMSQAAETMVREGRVLHLRKGKLEVCDGYFQGSLSEILRTLAGRRLTEGQAMQLVRLSKGEPDAEHFVLQFFRMPRGTGRSARVLVVVNTEGTKVEIRRTALLQAAFRLTPAEADVALRVAGGATLFQVAEARAATVGTVRSQLKAVMAKLGVRRQAQLAAKVAAL